MKTIVLNVNDLVNNNHTYFGGIIKAFDDAKVRFSQRNIHSPYFTFNLRNIKKRFNDLADPQYEYYLEEAMNTKIIVEYTAKSRITEFIKKLFADSPFTVEFKKVPGSWFYGKYIGIKGGIKAGYWIGHNHSIWDLEEEKTLYYRVISLSKSKRSSY